MIIKFEINDFLFEIFPVEKNNLKKLKEYLEKYYSVESIKPEIKVKDNILTIEIDIKGIQKNKSEYEKLINLCEQGKYEEAKPIAKKLINQNPKVSDYYRIYGQILSDQGDQDEAINNLIDALRWDPTNVWALVMMGNIYSKFKDDIDTALTYYKQALAEKPDDNITLNNIGANLMQAGQTNEAINYFEKALIADPKYPNTHFALAMVSEKDNNFINAFQYSVDALKYNPRKDSLYKNSLSTAINSAKYLVQNTNVQKPINDFIFKLENQGTNKIKIEVDNQIATVAKIEYAENYDRNFHLVKYKSNYPAVEHLVMHELMHLELALEAKKTNSNNLFVTNQSFKSKFLYSLGKFQKKLLNKGVDKRSADNYMQALFDGINGQVFNTPIDLFIEDRIFDRYQNLRPYQFLSLYNMLLEAIKANTKPEIVKNTPKKILSKSKIYNLVNALHFKSLYNVDLLDDFNPNQLEIKQANEFYEEFIEYRYDKQPGEEYEIIQHWAEDLKLDAYFELIPEDKSKRKDIDQVLSEMTEDPFGIDSYDKSTERKMKKFLDSHKDKELNKAVLMHMVSALEYFDNLDKPKTKEIAFEFATLGMTGIDPNKDGYEVNSIEDKKFSGYKALAYYYVSWAIAIPEMLSQLQMPFDKEFELAKKLTTL